MAALAAAMLGVTTTLAVTNAGSSPNRLHVVCGVQRWIVKTLQDRPRLLPVRSATIAYLVHRPVPRPLPLGRAPFERLVFRVDAAVTLVRSEPDGDLHIVLSSGRQTMIAEAPSPSCTGGATAFRRHQMSSARAAVGRCGRARVTGVAFFDFFHRQTGVAANAIELHPVLDFKCESGAPQPVASPPPVPPPPSPGGGNCAPSYPDVCIPPPPPDLDCKDIPYRNFRVVYDVPDPDPHHFDGDHDGIGCET
jgi:hypothetical protein